MANASTALGRFFNPDPKFASKVRVEVVGEEQLLADIERLGTAGLDAAKRVVLAKMREVVAKAKALTPDDPETSGLLKDTIRAYANRSRTKKTVGGGVIAGGKLLEQRLGKRGYSAWALVQHEDLTLKHTSGGPKYLERPFMEVLPSLPDAILDELDKVAAGAGA